MIAAILVVLIPPVPDFCGLRRDGHREVVEVVRGGVASEVCSVDARKDGGTVWFEASPTGQLLAVLVASEPSASPIRIFSLNPPYSRVHETGHSGYLALGMRWVGERLLSFYISAKENENGIRDYILKEWSIAGSQFLGKAEGVDKLPFPNPKYPANMLPPNLRSEFYITDIWYNRFGMLPIPEWRKTFVYHGNRIEVIRWGDSKSKVLLSVTGDATSFRLLRKAGPEHISVTIAEQRNPSFVGPPGGMTDAIFEQQTERYSSVLYNVTTGQFTIIPGYVCVQVLPKDVGR